MDTLKDQRRGMDAHLDTDGLHRLLDRAQELARLAADWPNEMARLEAEQAEDLDRPELGWWQPRELTEEEWFEIEAEAEDYQQRGYGL